MIDAHDTTESRLVTLARQAARLPSLWLTIVVGIAMVLLGQILFGLPVLLLVLAITGGSPLTWSESFADAAVPSAIYQTSALVVVFLGVYVVVWIWLARYERRPFWTAGFERRHAAARAARGALVGVSMLGGAAALMMAMGYATFADGPPQMQGVPAVPGVLIAAVGWAVQGTAEELVCRGWMLPVIAARYRLRTGVLVSALFFAGLHGVNPSLTPIALLNLVLYGLFAALYALREGGIWGIGAQHAAWNWAQGNLLGFEVSGVRPTGGMLIHLAETGPDEVTGGAFGPEGGLAITLVLLIGIVALLAVRRASETPPPAMPEPDRLEP